jgi:hypothetical protein
MIDVALQKYRCAGILAGPNNQFEKGCSAQVQKRYERAANKYPDPAQSRSIVQATLSLLLRGHSGPLVLAPRS